jgi:AraC-like DNA-binding protein
LVYQLIALLGELLRHQSTGQRFPDSRVRTGPGWRRGPARVHLRRVRPEEARRLLIAGAATAAEAAHTVGYASPTQFNREYNRTYGLPPAQDAAYLRQRLA